MAETVEKILSATANLAKEALKEERVTFKEEFNKVRDNVLGKLPSPEEFFKLVERMKDMTDEEKEQLKQNIAERAMNAGKFKKVMGAQKRMEATYQHYLFFIVMVLLVVLVVGFFGYKLYKSIMDKEMRRENRGKGKQSRKKDKAQGAATSSAPNSPKAETQSSQKKKDL